MNHHGRESRRRCFESLYGPDAERRLAKGREALQPEDARRLEVTPGFVTPRLQPHRAREQHEQAVGARTLVIEGMVTVAPL
jgi:hypothetical protein